MRFFQEQLTKQRITKQEVTIYIPYTCRIWETLNNSYKIFQQIYLTIMSLLNTIRRIHRNLHKGFYGQLMQGGESSLHRRFNLIFNVALTTKILYCFQT
ncbi:hypothetical protein AO411_2025605 [Salmonella enterica subsp. enterica serovar Sarajane]|nr:hypothetical protein AO411_2025605 [Salmonella enterica subsp. enterica serovar Sarajane]